MSISNSLVDVGYNSRRYSRGAWKRWTPTHNLCNCEEKSVLELLMIGVDIPTTPFDHTLRDKGNWQNMYIWFVAKEYAKMEHFYLISSNFHHKNKHLTLCSLIWHCQNASCKLPNSISTIFFEPVPSHFLRNVQSGSGQRITSWIEIWWIL